MTVGHEDYDCAVEILEQTLVRLNRERDGQRALLEDLVEQIRICELMVMEADVGVAAVEALLAGGLYVHGGPTIAKWDERELTYARAGMLPPARVEQITAVEPPPETDEPSAPAAAVEAAPPAPPQPPMVREAADDETALYGVLERLAGDAPEVTVSLKILAEETGIPHGSVLFTVRRLAEAGRIEIVPDLRVKGAKKPNTYRLCARVHVLADPPVVVETTSVALRIPVEHDEAWLEITGPGVAGLKAQQCRWPLDDPGPGNMDRVTFCPDRSLDDSSYCAAHERKAHGKAAGA